MCGRFASTLPPDAIRALFRTAGPAPNLAPSWNVAPTQDAMVVRRHPETSERRLDLLRWGLIPSWTKDLKQRASRSTPGQRRPAVPVKAALEARRCLVPVDAFYEWRTMPDGKQPYAIARRDGTPLAFAGLWEGWRSSDGEVVRTFAILTTSANATMAQLHERMPVILEPDAWSAWLGEEDADARALMRPAGDDVLQLWPVSRAINAVRNNEPDLLDRIDDPHAPPPSDAPPGANPA